uniref:Uncharacterized protein n=1 Tax=Triticum urartu TaxID=4572 RepID=A0A8R7VEA6_TRIUA
MTSSSTPSRKVSNPNPPIRPQAAPRVAGRPARRLQVQGLRQPPEMGDRGGRRRGHALRRRDVPAAGRLPRALPHGGTSGHFPQPGADAPAHLQQRAHLLRYTV